MKPKLHRIQYLRAFAVVLVLLFHATITLNERINYEYASGIFGFGYMGVDLFFVISGFIICYIHYSDFGERRRLRSYYVRRMTRIYPVYWIVLVPVIAFNFLVPSYGDGFERELPEILQSWFLIPQSHQPILRVAWTLWHELFFYFLFGLLFIWNRNLKLLIGTIAVWGILSSGSMFIHDHGVWLWSEYVFSPHNLEFLGGCGIAVLLRRNKLSPRMAYWALGIGIVLLSGAWTNEYWLHVSIPRVIAWGIPSFFLVISVCAWPDNAKVSKNGLFAYLGDASYSIYLIHLLGIHLFYQVFNRLDLFNRIGNFSMVTACAIGALVAGCMFYSIVEAPVMKRIRNWAAKKKSIKLSASSPAAEG
ncbi:acyltransferase [Cohnella sp. AR92]|uniref:acyltransferase family protein n=1 Tax=Cohnella sp. AR92 TaxID=648716 RepID=UPI001315394D|nr:acyltransferase [Cohnella sp. AR92]